jgi:hypothetical protein
LLLEAKNISVYYGAVKAIEEVYFTVNPKEIMAMLCILQKDWLAKLKGYKVSLVGLFHPESFRD